MRSFFYRSKLLILVFSISACMLTLSSAAIIKFQFTQKKAFESLSKEYAVGVLQSYAYDDDTVPTMTNVLSFIYNTGHSFILAKNYEGRGRGILYTEDTGFHLPLINGRLFDNSDFENKTNTILISEDVRPDCVERQGMLYYRHDNREYEVIGIYEGQAGNSVEETVFYVNLAAEWLQETPSIGTYILDTGTSSLQDFENLKTYIEGLDELVYVDFDKGLSEDASRFRIFLENSTTIIAVILAGSILVLLNSFSATTVWIYARQKEIGIRKMLGATNAKIYFMIMKQYIVLIASSYILGSLPAFFIVHFSAKIRSVPTVFLLFGDQIDIRTIGLAFLLLLTEGLLILLLILRAYRKKRIIENIK